MDQSGGLTALIIFLLLPVVVFLLVRQFWLWYWKVNEQIALLKEIMIY